MDLLQLNGEHGELLGQVLEELTQEDGENIHLLVVYLEESWRLRLLPLHVVLLRELQT